MERERFDFVYHLAAYAAERRSHYIRPFNYRNNVVGSAVLIDAAIRYDVKCFVFTSSMAVYGQASPPMKESDTPDPCDPYGIAKYAIELDLRAARTVFGLPYIIFRPHNVYGEFQNIYDPYRNVVGIFMRQGLQGQPMTVVGDGTQTRAFSHFSDVAPTIARAPLVKEAMNETFNIGADVPCTVVALAHEVATALGVPHNVRFLPEGHEVKHAYTSHDKVRQVFDLPPPVALLAGLQRMAAWARGDRKAMP
jgi:UDP-glucose 4-epimerase